MADGHNKVGRIDPIDFMINMWPSPELREIKPIYKIGGIVFCVGWFALAIGALF